MKQQISVKTFKECYKHIQNSGKERLEQTAYFMFYVCVEYLAVDT